MSTEKNNQYPLFASYYQTYMWVLNTIERTSRSIKFTLGDRIVIVSTEVLELIIEAIYNKNKKPILMKINIRLEKLRIFFRILFDSKHISEKQYAHISEKINENGKMTGGWIKQCSE